MSKNNPGKVKINWQNGLKDWPFGLSEMAIDPFKSALLIIDMQRDSDLPLTVLPNNIKLLELFRKYKLKVFYCRVGDFLPDGRDYHIKRRLTWRRASASDPITIRPRGSLPYEIREELFPAANDPVLDKNTGSAFSSSAMDSYLWAMGIQTLVICGIATSRCVENTARDAADKGYNVILVDDACGDRIPENHQTTMHTFGRIFGSVKNTSDVIHDFSRLMEKAGSL